MWWSDPQPFKPALYSDKPLSPVEWLLGLGKDDLSRGTGGGDQVRIPDGCARGIEGLPVDEGCALSIERSPDGQEASVRVGRQMPAAPESSEIDETWNRRRRVKSWQRRPQDSNCERARTTVSTISFTEFLFR